MGDEIIWIVLFFLTIPLFMFISCVTMWVRTNALKDDLRELRRLVDRLRQQLDAALRNKEDLRWGQNTPPQPQQPQKEYKEHIQPAPPAEEPPAGHDFGVYNYTADTPTPAPPQQPAGGIPTAAPIPPASPIPPATPTPRSSVPLSSPAPEVFDTDQAWEDEAPRRRTAAAQPQRPTSANVSKTYDIPSTPTPPQPPASSGFEWQFGRRLPVWIGGVAIALSGFYLVKYSIEQGLLTREVRIFLGFIMGCILIYGARYIRLQKSGMADGTRIAQALAGSGVAVLYGTVYAATSLYHFLAPWQGFMGMAIITALAVVLALLHGMPIALLGLLGGFLTPALIGSHDPNAPLLFFYLYCLVTGLFATIRRQNWWVLGIPTVLLAFAWVAFWLAGSFRAGDGIWLGLFIIATAVTVAWQSAGIEEDTNHHRNEMSASDYSNILNYIVAGGSVVLMGTVATRSGFGLQELGLYGLLGLGTFVMAYFKPRLYHYAPWLSMVVSLAMMAFWREQDSTTYGPVLLGFAALYGLGSFWLLRARPALEWAGLLSATGLGFYGLAYIRLQSEIYGLLNVANTGAVHLWGFIAIVLVLLFALLTASVLQSFKGDEGLRQRLLAVFALTTTAFLSIALTIEVRREFLPVAFAAEVLAVCWINTRVSITALRKIAAILFGVFVLLMLEQLAVLFAVVLNSLFGYSLRFWRDGLPLAQDPMFQLGLPMVMLGVSAWLIQRQRDGKLAETFEMATVGLGALLLYYMTRHAFNVPEDVLFTKPQFFERGIMTNLFFAAGLAVVYAGRLFSRRAILWSGTAIFLMALFRVIWFDFITQNPLWTGQPVGAQFFMNSLLLPYALPLFWLWLEERPQLRLMTVPQSLRSGFTLLLIFTFISLQVRQCFHGSILNSGPTENAEIYAYSVVWLGLGAFLLFLGTKRKDKMIRVASLVVMLLTIAKVFLYDAGNLEGLYRVASFLGLGLSLLALSWFYSRFVFVKEKE
ncbi:MAG: DUF2339 domain-containing protein [Alphaproteobacteria bacterium]